MQKKINFFNISEKFNSFIWAPPKTATHTLSWLLFYYDFKTYGINNQNELVQVESLGLNHFGHNFMYPPNHQSFSFICSLRNPYERFFSFYKMQKFSNKNLFNSIEEEPTIEDFEKFFYDTISNENQISRFAPKFTERKPDYIIRVESFYDDMCTIPFIKNSLMFESGILKELCEKKFNNSFPLKSEKFFNENIKNAIYDICKEEFEIGGYTK